MNKEILHNMSDNTNLELDIKKLIVQSLDLKVDPAEIADEEILFGGGLGLDSVATLEIVFALEEKFGIEVADEDLRVDLFTNVHAMTDYVRKKLC